MTVVGLKTVDNNEDYISEQLGKLVCITAIVLFIHHGSTLKKNLTCPFYVDKTKSQHSCPTCHSNQQQPTLSNWTDWDLNPGHSTSQAFCLSRVLA